MKQVWPLVEPTTLAGYTEAIKRALEAAGVEPQQVFEHAHVEQVRSNDPLLRITDSQINAVYARAVAATGDTGFGLRVAQHVLPGMLHALGYALLASETLEDFCQRLVRYWALIAQGADYEVNSDSTELCLRAQLRNPGLCFESQDTFAAVVLRLMRMVSGVEFKPLRVELTRPLPVGGDGDFLATFCCPVSFGQDAIRLYFDIASMRQPLPGASRELAQHNDQIVMRYLEELDQDDIVNRVRARIVTGLSAGGCSRAQIAQSMHMSQSTLQGRLVRAGFSFQQLLDDTRHELALGYLEQRRLSITEIAFMLGFSDLSNFIRAFKRWTGKAPTDFRSGGCGGARNSG
jgi:AraC-like DNA-binding protein